jgi:hypothetical protein
MTKYTIYCDESEKDGKYYSDFYGGVLVKTTDVSNIEEDFSKFKCDNKFFREFSFKKIGCQDEKIYCLFIDKVFDLVDSDKIKIRLMFRQNIYNPPAIVESDNSRYCKLYYQFLKHSFALEHSEFTNKKLNVSVFLDTMPEKDTNKIEFKNWVSEAINNMGFKSNPELIQEKKSHEHILLQAVDVVMGGIQFRLNEKHKEKPIGKKRRGKKTIIKEKIFKHILKKIRKLKPANYKNFNIGVSTGNYYNEIYSHRKSRFVMRYRHWSFKPNGYILDKSKKK